MCQISSALPEFCGRYYKKHFGLFFSGHSLYVAFAKMPYIYVKIVITFTYFSDTPLTALMTDIRQRQVWFIPLADVCGMCR